MNKVFLVGRATADPQGSITSTGNTMSRISLTVQDNFNKNEVYFFPCIAWQNQAKFINTYIKKGDLIAIDGKLVRKPYVNKDGVNIYNTNVVIENVKILSSPNQKRQFDNDNNKPYENNFSNEDIIFEENEEINLDSNKNNNSSDVDDIVDLDWLNEIE